MLGSRVVTNDTSLIVRVGTYPAAVMLSEMKHLLLFEHTDAEQMVRFSPAGACMRPILWLEEVVVWTPGLSR